MLKIRGISNAENLLMGVNRFGHCLTEESAASVASRLERLAGLFFFLQSVALDLSIELVKLAELSQNLFNFRHFSASLCLPDPALSPSSS